MHLYCTGSTEGGGLHFGHGDPMNHGLSYSLASEGFDFRLRVADFTQYTHGPTPQRGAGLVT